MTTLPVAEARATFSKLVDLASTTHERFEITRNGSRAAVLLGADDYDGLMETLEILSDPEATAAIREGQRELAEGKGVPLEDVIAEFHANGLDV